MGVDGQINSPGCVILLHWGLLWDGYTYIAFTSYAPTHAYTVMDPSSKPWPAPHPNWYRYPAQKVFRSVLKKRDTLKPIYFPDYTLPRLKVPAPRSHLLSERALIEHALPHPSQRELPSQLKKGLRKA